MWDLPGPGLEPVSPVLAGGFLTTVPPGKPSTNFLKVSVVVTVQSVQRDAKILKTIIDVSEWESGS